MERFNIGEFDIDVSRCRVSSPQHEVILEPKVMDLLKFLYRHKGQVVSQEYIFASVWPNTTYNPSSIQRCIALLRKALQEDAKNAKFLITHPKRGYSLEVPNTATIKKAYVQYGIVLTVVFLVVVTAWLFVSKTQIPTQFSQLLPITSNEANESYLSVSPDGKYLAFVRGNELKNNVWVREVTSGLEVKLTNESAVYSSLGWSNNSSALAYIEERDAQRAMYYASIDRVSFSVVANTSILNFSNLEVSSRRLQWHNNNKIYFVETDKTTNNSWLSYVDLNDQSKHRLLEAKGQDWIKTLALSPEQNQIALAYDIGTNRNRIDLVDMETLVSSTLLYVNDDIQGLSWHPSGESILISNSARLQLVDMSGELSDIHFNNYKSIHDAQFNPNGTEIFMELTNLDVDILRKKDIDSSFFETLVDSSSLDYLPIFSPDDSRFVFLSHRTGKKQLYVYEGGQQKMIFSNPNNDDLLGVVWTPDGSEVITASKDKLFRIDVRSAKFKETSHGLNAFSLREHFKHEPALLVAQRTDEDGVFHIAKLDLDSLQLTTYKANGKRLVCYSMSLNSEDQIFFTNSKAVFRVNSDLTQEEVWSTQYDYISGVRVAGNKLSLRLDKGNRFKLVTIDMETGTEEVVYKGAMDGDMLINMSHDEQEFLYLSKPKKTSELVRLQ